MANTITSFKAGDLVVSVSGDGDGSGTYTDNQATQITLEEINPTTGAIDGTLVLPSTTSTVNGVTERAISGEYGSSSEGSLALSTDGQSLTIAGYGVNAATFNAGESNGNNVYGDPRLAQSTSVQGGQFTAVPRVVADIRFDGTVDTSTSLYNIYNGQNPRSVVTADGSSFYLSGQGVKNSTNEGVFQADDGASTFAPIYTATDTRAAGLYNGTLYVSADSSINKGTGNISSFGMSPSGPTNPTPLPGITGKVTLAVGQGNSINNSSGTIDLSPENFFFADPTTLYIADSGNPKGGTAGDGGLQKWSLVGGTWQLDYTVSNGLGLVANTTADPGQGGAATTGLIGLTGKVNTDGTVSIYATNATVGDLNATALYATTDTLANTVAPAGESFTALTPAASDTNIRGVAFAPQAAACYVSGTRIATARGEVAVEALAVGDAVVTASGALREIVWLGHRTVDCRTMDRRGDGDLSATLPIRIAAHAFGARRPARDLLVSPGHAICVDVGGEVLIPASALVDGTTIVQVAVDSVTYWHVELATHDIILAENLPAESYLEMGNRGFFVEADAVALRAVPDAPVATHDDFCRPFHPSGAMVAAVRTWRAARAAALDARTARRRA